MAKANHNWKRNTLSIESDGHKYVIDLRNQSVSEELESSNSDSEDSNRWEWGSAGDRGGKEPNEEGVLELDECSEDGTSSLAGLFHWQMEDYEVFHPKCHMLQICEIGQSSSGMEEQSFSSECGRYQEGMAQMDDMPTH